MVPGYRHRTVYSGFPGVETPKEMVSVLFFLFFRASEIVVPFCNVILHARLDMLLDLSALSDSSDSDNMGRLEIFVLGFFSGRETSAQSHRTRKPVSTSHGKFSSAAADKTYITFREERIQTELFNGPAVPGRSTSCCAVALR